MHYKIIEVARRACAAVMEIYGTNFSIAEKLDLSPVTEADKKYESIILHALNNLMPQIPVVAEDSVFEGQLPEGDGNVLNAQPTPREVMAWTVRVLMEKKVDQEEEQNG